MGLIWVLGSLQYSKYKFEVFFCQYVVIFISIVLYYNLSSDIMMPPALIFPRRIASDFHSLPISTRILDFFLLYKDCHLNFNDHFLTVYPLLANSPSKMLILATQEHG